ncbi:MAG: hypothetical protein CBC49_003155 [Alphaproteobacteria bacterium TMED89]|nr:hypothetical protein [Rhodospirillaceae bacterium]RPH17206.1 MAG: hypothetical protein CBC49_003155 [Alphaproteobacteria bacterium TMED89]
MKKFLIAGSSLAAVAAAGSVGAVDVTLGGSIDMGVEFGLGKNEGNLSFVSAYNSVSLSLSAAGTTDHGIKYGAAFSIGTAAELEFDAYDTNGADVAGGKHLIKMTVAGGTDLEGVVYNVSGGQQISAANIVGVKINSSWHSVDATKTAHGLSVPSALAASNMCKIAGRVAQQAGVMWLDFQTSLGLTNINAYRVTGSGASSRIIASGSTPQIGGSYSPPAIGVVTPILFKQTDNGGALTGRGESIVSSAYLPAGKLGQSIFITGSGSSITAKSVPGIPSAIVLAADNGAGKGVAVHLPGLVSSVPILSDDSPTATSSALSASTASAGLAVVEFGSNTVVEAEVYAGPFAEVKLQSSSTKMVIGAVCVEGVDSSATNYFLDNASKVVTATDASIFIEGGFGKLTLQTGD